VLLKHRVWGTPGARPCETFKFSTDPQLKAKVRDVVGLSLNPPAHAIVLCVDEKSQIQALEPTQPSRPVRPGLAKHPQVHLHFTPTYSVAELVAAIGRFCQGWNQRCQPFTWTKDGDQILATLNGGNTTATSGP
jgi:hypothetical protein